ncbi:hypothetical protein FT663_01880 [Candidozyma haemuli var. vulneris]|uniref:Autophagy-related protein 17 n=1 Tax=Candidozyma haemuli TaxID=45357 RepID=A0A2V1AMF5_9ASCO|nr:hypothetical protein CXQ85_003313 [[Candida] haemuloni]KAF3993376.1 hypothetical protein FT663_01880 [[Candida] haemuloni var. vulneris]KAF3993833.1 hypothetical protein FT662_00281 [[Candida] haemuloni var. vulneris]PVH19467.1 hypothetical protein CXQ85_003313 [[Candida] haemuloni]
MAFPPSEVQQWAQEAFRTLERARELSSSAQNVLESTAHILGDQLPKKVQTATENSDLIMDQHANITALIEHLRVQVKDTVIGAHHNAVDTQLKPVLTRLDEVLGQLGEVPVPEALLGDDVSEKSAYKHLSDFVAREEIDLLKENINIYLENADKACDLLSSQLEILLKEYHKNSRKFLRLHKSYNTSIAEVAMLLRFAAMTQSPPKEQSNFIRTILKENGSLEQELVSLLEMLTNHYDQCSIALDILKSNSESDGVNYEVLQNDTAELPHVLREFAAIHDIIMNNETRAAKFVESKLPAIEGFIEQSSSLSEANVAFKNEKLTGFVLLLLKVEEILRSCSVDVPEPSAKSAIDLYTDVVKHLLHHYTQFYATFKQHYITELHYEQYVYPRKYVKMLDDFLHGPLLELEEEEKDRRAQWLTKYGDYIPKELVLPGFSSQPYVVQVTTEGLEMLQTETAEEDEAKLLSLLKRHHGLGAHTQNAGHTSRR